MLITILEFIIIIVLLLTALIGFILPLLVSTINTGGNIFILFVSGAMSIMLIFLMFVAVKRFIRDILVMKKKKSEELCTNKKSTDPNNIESATLEPVILLSNANPYSKDELSKSKRVINVAYNTISLFKAVIISIVALIILVPLILTIIGNFRTYKQIEIGGLDLKTICSVEQKYIMYESKESSYIDFLLVKYEVTYITNKLTKIAFRDYIEYLQEEGFVEDTNQCRFKKEINEEYFIQIDITKGDNYLTLKYEKINYE